MKIGLGASFFWVVGLLAPIATAEGEGPVEELQVGPPDKVQVESEGQPDEVVNPGLKAELAGLEAFVPDGYSGAYKQERFPTCRSCINIYDFDDFEREVESNIHSRYGKKSTLNLCGWRGVIDVGRYDGIDIDDDDVNIEIVCCGTYGKSCTFDGQNYYRSDDVIEFSGTVKHFSLRGFTFQNFGGDKERRLQSVEVEDVNIESNLFDIIDFQNTAKFEFLYNVFHSNAHLDLVVNTDSEYGSVGKYIGNEFSNNDADDGVAIIDLKEGDYILKDNVFYRNRGQTISISDSTVEIINTKFIDNYEPGNGRVIDGDGGAIDTRDTVLTLKGCLFYKNKADENGGAIFAEDSHITAYDTKFIQNKAGGSGCCGDEGGGGAIFGEGYAISLHRCSFIRNEATEGEGGAIRAGDADEDGNDPGCLLELFQCTFESNKALGRTAGGGKGGAIQICDGHLISHGSTFVYNRADEDGGAIDADDTRVESYGDTFKFNSAEDGGALSLDCQSSVCSGSKFISNRAKRSGSDECDDGEGGAVKVREAVFRSKGCTYTGNTASDEGDNIYLDDSILYSCKDSFNKKSSYGGQTQYGGINYGGSYYGGGNYYYNGIEKDDDSCVEFECPATY